MTVKLQARAEDGTDLGYLELVARPIPGDRVELHRSGEYSTWEVSQVMHFPTRDGLLAGPATMRMTLKPA